MFWARNVEGKVFEVIDFDPADIFHGDLVWVQTNTKPEQGDLIDEQGNITKPPPPVVSIEDRKLALGSIRYDKEVAGCAVFFSGGKAMVGTDRDSQAKINAAFSLVIAGLMPAGVTWKLLDGNFQALTNDDVKLMAGTTAQYVQACYTNEAKLATELQHDIDTDLTVGWPARD